MTTLSFQREVQNRRNYQHALLRQIEEKRHQIEMLKEKEKYEEEVLTKRLEQQLKTMKLEEALEKEKLRIEKVRFETEQSKLKRQQLLAKLEKERKVLDSRETKSENDKESVLSHDNRVYKYFSNSARKEFSHRRRHSFIEDEKIPNEKLLNEKTLNIRKEMSSEHSSEPEEILKKKDKCMECISTSCPFCKIKLKSYDCWCIKCAREVTDFKGVENKSLVCDNCEKKYLICKFCEEGVDKCANCKKRRNICLDCLRNVCFNCGESPNAKSRKPKSLSSERSFQILDINYPTSEEDFESNTKPYRPPFSINIDKNSKFHPNYKEGEVLVDENFERLRIEANNKVKNYVKHYGDIMSPRTKPTEKDLYMPLLKEMPRRALTAKGEEILSSKPNNELEKWDIPAIQRNYISKTSPKVITQLGAIRKQLQEEIFFDSNP